MNTTTRTLIAIPMAAAALSVGSAPVWAETPAFDPSDIVIANPEPEPEPDPPAPEPGPQIPGDKVGPAGDPGPGGPDDLDGPNPDDGDDPLDGPDDLDGPNPDRDDDDDSDDSDDDDGDDNDSDDDDSDDNDVKRPTRVDAGAADDGLSFAWLLASGALVTAAGGFTARRAALKRR